MSVEVPLVLNSSLWPGLERKKFVNAVHKDQVTATENEAKGRVKKKVEFSIILGTFGGG